jgi:molybdopterin molybdotransferase
MTDPGTARAAPTPPPDDPMLLVEVARGRVLEAIGGPLPAETLAIEATLGRVAAAEVRATTDLPPWDNSAMDGYAVRGAEVAAASEAAPIVLTVVGEAAAGGASGPLVEAGTAIRIATGAPLPEGADTVVQVELTTPLNADGSAAGLRGRQAIGSIPASVAIHATVPIGSSIRRRGSDLTAGTVVLQAGATLGPGAIGLVAGSGVGSVAVHRRPIVAVLATGDEVRPAGNALDSSGIPDANGPGLRALAAAAGADVVDLGIARDRLDDVVERLRRGVAQADIVIVSGGVSVGPYDLVRAGFEAVGQIELWRVALQPGKPFAFGTARRADGSQVLLFGLPGNPVSSFVTFEIFVRPALRRLAGHADPLRPSEPGVLMEPVTKSRGRRAYLRVEIDHRPNGAPVLDREGRLQVRLAGARSTAGQGSHVLSTLAAADALAAVPEAFEDVPPGTEVEVFRLDR